MLLVMLLTSGLYNGYTNFQFGEDCKDLKDIQDTNKECEKTWNTIFSIGNKISETNLIEV